jgi:hypothetical protein
MDFVSCIATTLLEHDLWAIGSAVVLIQEQEKSPHIDNSKMNLISIICGSSIVGFSEVETKFQTI